MVTASAARRASFCVALSLSVSSMLNKIWFWLLCIGIVYGFGKAAYQSKFPPGTTSRCSSQASDPQKQLSPQGSSTTLAPPLGKRLNAASRRCQNSVEICIGLIGIMALWLGIMNVAKDAGLIAAFASRAAVHALAVS